MGHLDLMRCFQKAIRRANLPIKYSEGYSPHQILSFAAPLGVGLTSNGEYMEMELYEEAKDIAERLQGEMPEGINILSANPLPDNAKNAMASLAAAGYIVSFKPNSENSDVSGVLEYMKKELSEFYKEGREIIVTKKTKKGERTLDIAPFIYEFTLSQTRDTINLYMLVAAGSTENIRPELVTEAFMSYMGMEFSMSDIKIFRTDMYEVTQGKLISMEEAYR